ncbi:hypothetical protein [Micromonospora sp. DT233]|uniref:hypothetical protein n=1 Tax=Micromonospora sp. DT233 TaxID=3393432 RepID=UPI003CFA60B5
MSGGERIDAVRAARALTSDWLLEAQELITGEFGSPLTGVTAGTEQAATDELHVLGCLSLALAPADDATGAAHVGPGPGGAGAAHVGPGPGGAGAAHVGPGPGEGGAGAGAGRAGHDRLLTDPIEVTFPPAPGGSPRVEWLTLDEIVAAARERRGTIRRLVDAYRVAMRFVDADLDRLRREIGELRHRAALAGGDPALLDGPATRLAGLAREAVADPVGCGRPGPWRDGLAGLAEELAAVRREVVPVAEDPDRLPALQRRLRSSVRRLRRLADEAAREGLGDGGDPVASLDIDGLLARVAAARSASPAGGTPVDGEELVAALDRAIDLVDAARRRLRGRCHLELNGRLAAYRQRAADEGRAEHPDLDQSYRDARDRLRPDGFAVTAASQAVRAYQQAVNEVRP